MGTPRTAENNPFTPGYGVVPRVWAGRHEEFVEFDDVVLPRLRQGTYEPARLLIGDRGVGKTAFLATLESDAAERGDWAVRVDAVRGESLVQRLARGVAETLSAEDAAARVTEALAAALAHVGGVQLGPSGVSVVAREPSGHHRSASDHLTTVLLEAGARARSRGKVLMILLDEVQNAATDDLAPLCHALQRAQASSRPTRGPRGERRHVHAPLAVVLAGLPALVERVRGDGATFFERARVEDFGLLSDVDVRDALVRFAENEDVGVDDEALEVMAAAIGGYPFFIHLIGSCVWLAGERGEVITRADATAGVADARPRLARFYADRLRGLGDVQYRWLTAAASLPDGDLTAGAVADLLGASSGQYGWLVESLVDRGLLRHARGRGRLAIAVPGLADYLRDPEF